MDWDQNHRYFMRLHEKAPFCLCFATVVVPRSHRNIFPIVCLFSACCVSEHAYIYKYKFARGADLWKISCVLYSQIPCFLRKRFFQIQGMLGCIMQKNVYIHSPVCSDEWPQALYEKDTRVALTSLLHFNIQETLLNNRALHIFLHISLPQNTFLLNLLSAHERLMDTQNSFSRLL